MTQEVKTSPYATFYNNEFLADCTIENTEAPQETHKTHKLILAANSQFFSKYFHDHKDQDTSKVTLPKFIKSSHLDASKQNVFPKVLEFFYSNHTLEDLVKIGLTKENAFAFLNHFTGLDAQQGKNLTQQFVKKEVLNTKNVTDCLFDAIKSEDQELKKQCVETLIPVIADVLNDKDQRIHLLKLPLPVFEEILTRDDIKVANENALLNIVVDYIESKEALPERPVAQPAPVGEAEKKEEKKAEERKEPEKKEAEVKPEKKEAEVKPAEPKKEEAPKDGKAPEAAAAEKKEELPKTEAPKEGEKKVEPPKEGEKKVEPPKEGEKKEGEAAPKVEEKPAEQKKEEPAPAPVVEKKKPEEVKAAAAVANVRDLEAEAQEKLKLFKLTVDEKRGLVKHLRLPHVSHEALVKAAAMPIFAEFKDIFIESLSAKLNSYETAHVEKYTINEKPRQYTEPIKAVASPNKQPDANLVSHPPSTKSGKGTVNQEKTLSGQKEHQSISSDKTSQQQQQSKVRLTSPNKVSPNPQKNLSSSHISPPRSYQQDFNRSGEHRDFDHYNSQFAKTTGQNFYQSVPRSHQSPPRDHFYGTSPQKMYQSPDKQNYNSLTRSYDNSRVTGSYNSGGSGKKDFVRKSSQPITFTYTHDFDENGALFYLGTHGKQTPYANPHEVGQVQAFFSSLGKGVVADFVGRECENCRTLNEPNSFMGVDFGVNRYLIPTSYTIRNRNSNHHVLLNWILEASVDMKEWFVIDKRIHYTEDAEFNRSVEDTREDLKQKGYTSTWGVDEYQIEKMKKSFHAGNEIFAGFRYFRITQLNKNSSGSFNLALSGFEIYGVAIGENWSFE